MKKFIIFSLIAISALYNTAISQESYKINEETPDTTGRKHIFFNIGYTRGYGLGDFGYNLKDPMNGFNLGLGFHIEDTPLIVGLKWDYQVYDNIKFDGYDFYSYMNIFHLYGRIVPQDKYLAPYLEGGIGINMLITSSSYDTDYEEASETEWLSKDIAMSYGFGTGLLIALNENRSFMLDLGVKYIIGRNADYVPKGKISWWPPKKRTETTGFYYSISLAFSL